MIHIAQKKARRAYVRLEPQLQVRLQAFAKTHECTVSAAVRYAVERLLEVWQRFAGKWATSRWLPLIKPGT
jgi:hypothetical protein